MPDLSGTFAPERSAQRLQERTERPLPTRQTPFVGRLEKENEDQRIAV